jgi:fructan beta-fructosidase
LEVDRVTVPGATECPDIFELPVDNDSTNTRWVFWGASGCYLIGHFDGVKFAAEGEPRQFYCNGGERCNAYAAQTFSDVPDEDGRRIQIAWLQGALDGMPFNHQMSVPVVLTLKSTADGIRLCAEYVRELETAHGRRIKLDRGVLESANDALAGLNGDAFRLKGEFSVDENSVFALTVGGTELLIDCNAGELTCRDKVAPLPVADGNVALDVLIDRASIEIISAGGQVYMPLYRPLGDGSALSLEVRGGEPSVESLDVWEIESTWRQTKRVL